MPRLPCALFRARRRQAPGRQSAAQPRVARCVSELVPVRRGNEGPKSGQPPRARAGFDGLRSSRHTSGALTKGQAARRSERNARQLTWAAWCVVSADGRTSEGMLSSFLPTTGGRVHAVDRTRRAATGSSALGREDVMLQDAHYKIRLPVNNKSYSAARCVCSRERQRARRAVSQPASSCG